MSGASGDEADTWRSHGGVNGISEGDESLSGFRDGGDGACDGHDENDGRGRPRTARRGAPPGFPRVIEGPEGAEGGDWRSGYEADPSETPMSSGAYMDNRPNR